MKAAEGVPSSTYKVTLPDDISRHKIYFTIVGENVPQSLFLNCKAMESFQWVTSLMTSYTRQLDLGRDVADVVGDMKETFQPGGRYIIPNGSNVEVHSIVHHLGLVLEQHMSNKND